MSEEHRLHPAAIAVWSVEYLGRFVLGLVPLLAIRRGGLIALAIATMTVGGSVVRYLRFSYRLDGEALVVRGGLLWTFRRVIPLPRIQSVDLVQKLRHRLFGVVELRVEAAGGSQTEATLVALTRDDAEAIRDLLVTRSAAGPHPAEVVVPPLARLGPGDLLLAGVSGGRVAVIALLLGYVQEVVPDDVLIGVGERVERTGASGLAVVLAVVIVFLLLSVAISLVASLFVYWNFTLRREGDNLVIERGLLEKRRAVIPLRRVQGIRMDENLIRRAFGLASLRALTAGYTGSSEEQQESGTLLPIARRGDALLIASSVLGAPLEVLTPRLEPAPGRALVRRLAVAAAGGIVAAIAGVLLFGARGAAALAIPPLGCGLAYLSWRSLGHAMGGAHAIVRSGGLVRRTTFLAVSGVQHVRVTINPLQRLFGLATVRLAIPRASPAAVDLDGGRAGQRFRVIASKLIGSPAGWTTPSRQ